MSRKMVSDRDRSMGQEVARIGQQRRKTKIQGQSWICNIHLSLQMYDDWIVIIQVPPRVATRVTRMECDGT